MIMLSQEVKEFLYQTLIPEIEATIPQISYVEQIDSTSLFNRFFRLDAARKSVTVNYKFDHDHFLAWDQNEQELGTDCQQPWNCGTLTQAMSREELIRELKKYFGEPEDIPNGGNRTNKLIRP